MVGSWVKRNGEVGTEERRTDFSDEFFAGIGVVAKALAKISVATMRWRGPVNQFVQHCRVVAFGRTRRQCIDELPIGRHFDAVGGRNIAGAIAPVHDGRPGGCDESVGALDPSGHGFFDRGWLSRCQRRQAIDLIGIKDSVGTQHGNARHRLVADHSTIFRPFDGFSVDHDRAVLALANLRAEGFGLAVGHPCRGRVTVLYRLRPEDENIDAAIGCAVMPKRSD